MKTKHILLGMIAVFLSAIFISSCTKYPDGPKISLRSKKARLTGDWKIESVTYNGNDVTNQFNSNFEWDIESDGGYKEKAAPSGSTTVEISGKWKFGEDKDDVYFTPTGGTEYSCRITKLKNTELWFYHTEANGDKISYKLKQ